MNLKKQIDAKKLLPIVGWALLVTILAAIVLVMGYLILTTERPVNPPVQTSEVAESSDQDILDDFNSLLEQTEIANLVSVRGAEEAAVATRFASDKETNIEIVLNSDNPKNGYTYHAWLSNGQDYISVGALEVDQEDPELFITAYTSEVQAPTYNNVVISEEPTVSTNSSSPQTIVLQGVFE